MRGLIILFFFILLNNLLYSQNFDITRLGIREGLSQGLISTMCEDSDGFIWVGTLNGLNRYDGVRFQTYLHSPADPYSPAGNVIKNILEDSKGRIWIGYEGALDCFDRKTGRFYHLGTQYNVLNIKTTAAAPLFETTDGHIWLADLYQVIEMVVPEDFPANPDRIKDIRYTGFGNNRPFPVKDDNPVRDVTPYLTILPDGTPGVYYFDGHRFRYQAATRTWIEVSGSVQPEVWNINGHGMLLDPKKNGYWMRNRRNLQFIRDGKLQQQFTLPDFFENTQLAEYERPLAHCDENGAIWLFDDGSLYRITPPDQKGASLLIETILDARIEKKTFYRFLYNNQGTIFVGTNGYGLVRIITKKHLFSHLLNGFSVGKISILNKDTLLVNTNEHVYTVSPSGKLSPHFIALNPPVSPFVVLKASDGRLFSRYFADKKQFINIVYPHGQQENLQIPIALMNPADLLFEDQQERLWISSYTGEIACLPKGAKIMEHYDTRKLWKNHQTYIVPKQMYQSKNGVLWLTTDHGLVEIHAPLGKKPEFKIWQNNPQDPQSLSGNSLLSVLDDPADPDRYLWVTTSGNGFNKMDKKTGRCINFTQKNGLPNDVVYGILSDSRGNLWLSTNYGISCFNPTTNHFRNFTVDDGLQDNEFNTYAYLKFPDGNLCFGGINGLTMFHPDDIQPKSTFPPIFIAGLKINNHSIYPRDSTGILQQPIEYADIVPLKYDQNFLSIALVTVDFTKQHDYPVMYKMEGVDRDWVMTDSRTELSYPNLSPGTYTLRFANLNENGDRNPLEGKITFIISPPWWRSRMACLAYALLIFFAVWKFFQFQSRRLKLENDLLFKEKEAQTLQVVDEMKSRFFANITHEFRTPLTLILEPARQIGLTSDPDFIKKQSNIIHSNASRLLLLVNQLLDLSKIEGHKIQVNWSEGDLLLIIRDLFDWFQPTMQMKQQKFSLHCELKELQGIADRQLLEKIIYNLLSNAHKFTPETGTITISVVQPTTGTWQIKVTDTGMGIPAEKLSHIFDRFYQVDNTLTKRNEGTGIGLALVKELCELVDGHIVVESEVGKGTQITIDFPLRPTGMEGVSMASLSPTMLPERANLAVPSVEQADEMDPEDHQMILLVEDNAEMREYLHLMLTRNGFAVIEAENGRLGVDTALEICPDLIITDVMMPEMDGYEFTETIKNNIITSHIPIVVLTAKGRLENKIEGYRRGADAYLPKPFSTEELMVRIRQLLEVRQKIQEKYQQPRIADAINKVNDDSSLTMVSDASIEHEQSLSDLDKQWLKNLENIILDKIQLDDFNNDDLPTELLMNRTQFYSKVKSLTGLTPAILVRNIRLDAACQLLEKQPDLTVTEVMNRIGLTDKKHFTRNFKERFGYTPKKTARKNTLD